MEEEYKQIKIHFFLNEMKSGAVRKKKSDIKKSIYFYMVWYQGQRPRLPGCDGPGMAKRSYPVSEVGVVG